MLSVLDKMFKDLLFVFKFCGLSLKNRTDIDRLKSRFIFMLNAFMLDSDIILSVYWIITGSGNEYSFTDLTFLLSCLSYASLASTKIKFLFMKQDSIDQIIEDFIDLEAKHMKKVNNAIEKDIKKDANVLNLVTKIFKIVQVINLIVFTVFPIITLSIKFKKTGELEFQLPLIDFYTHLHTSSNVLYWLLKYIKQVYTVCVNVVYIYAADSFFITCCTYLRIQFKLLKHDMEELVPNDISEGPPGYDENIRTQLVKLIKWHQSLIRASVTLNFLYTESSLMNFLLSSFNICLSGFNVTTSQELDVVLTFLAFLFLALIQVFLLCYFGDLLSTSSVELSDSIYNCRWYLMNSAFRKDIHIMLIRSQKACSVKAWSYIDINLNAFMKVLSTSWSYLALLNTVYGSKEFDL